MNNKPNNQQGFSIIILAVIAVVVGVLVLGSFLLTSKKNPTPLNPAPSTSALSVPLTKKDPIQIQTESKLGTPECPEIDYTGCDTSGNFMTWKGIEDTNTPEPSAQSTIILK